MNSKEYKLTPGQQKAFDAILNHENVFLTGAAGSGKSFVVQQILALKEVKFSLAHPLPGLQS